MDHRIAIAEFVYEGRKLMKRLHSSEKYLQSLRVQLSVLDAEAANKQERLRMRASPRGMKESDAKRATHPLLQKR